MSCIYMYVLKMIATNSTVRRVDVLLEYNILNLWCLTILSNSVLIPYCRGHAQFCGTLEAYIYCQLSTVFLTTVGEIIHHVFNLMWRLISVYLCKKKKNIKNIMLNPKIEGAWLRTNHFGCFRLIWSGLITPLRKNPQNTFQKVFKKRMIP